MPFIFHNHYFSQLLVLDYLELPVLALGNEIVKDRYKAKLTPLALHITTTFHLSCIEEKNYIFSSSIPQN